MTKSKPVRKWWILAAMASALSMVFIDQSALPVALPTIQRELNVNSIILQWIINSYLLTLAVFIIFGGRVGDMIGHRKTFLVGMTVFVLSSMTCALAQSGAWIVTGRVVQGIGGAFMIPATAAIAVSAFPPAERGRGMGLYISVSSIFLILGPLIGGLLTQHVSWRWVFWINFPIAVTGVILTLIHVPASLVAHNPNEKMDWMGFIWLALCLFMLVFGLMEGGHWGWGSTIIVACFVISILSFISFVVVELRQTEPLVDLKLFKNHYFLFGALLMMMMQGSLISVVFWAVFLQDVLAASASQAGLMIIAAQIPVLFMAAIGGRWVDSHGPRIPATIGGLLVVLCCLWIAIFAWQQSYWWLLPGFFVFGCAVPLVISSAMNSAFSSVELHRRGVSSGIMNCARQIGGSVGLALMGLLITALNHSYLSQLLQAAPAPINTLQPSQIDGLLAHATSAQEAIQPFGQSSVAQVYNIAAKAYTFGFSWIMILAAFFGLIGLICAQKLPNKKAYLAMAKTPRTITPPLPPATEGS